MSKTKSLKQGDYVVMHSCIEAESENNYGRVWRCKSDQWAEGESGHEKCFVQLQDWKGPFLREYLQEVNLNENSTEAEEILELRRKLHESQNDRFEYEESAAEHQAEASRLARELDWYADRVNWSQGEYHEGNFLTLAQVDNGARARRALTQQNL